MDIIIGTHRGTPYTLSERGRLQHCYLCGATGVGKSGELENMVAQDLRSGTGVVLIDPHGGLAEKVISHIPPERADHLTYINLADTERPVGLNFIANIPAERQPKVAEDMVAAFVHIFGESAVAERSQQVLRNCLRAVMAADKTLLSIPRILTEEDYRNVVLKRVTDPFVLRYWSHQFAKYSDTKRDDVISPILNKFDAILTPALRNILAQQTSAVDLRKVMDEGRILIVNLATGTVGEKPAEFFGALLVTALAQAAFQRSVNPRPCHLYADEFQNYTTTGFVRILAETRKYGLALTLANQTLSSLETAVAQSILANVGSVFAFRCGREDAEALYTRIGLDSPGRIENLPDYTAWANLKQGRETSGPVFLHTIPPEAGISNAAKLIQNSRLKFGTRRSDVDRKLAKFSNVKQHHMGLGAS